VVNNKIKNKEYILDNNIISRITRSIKLSNSSALSLPKYRSDIDGLRGVAVLSVVAFHAFPVWLKGGFIGVDIFFVISGFLISTIIFENLNKKKFSFSNFYARRIRRIFPALLLVLFFFLILGWFIFLADEYKQISKHTMAGIGFVSNFILWSESGYFENDSNKNPLLHLWSLGIEEQFYFCWPFFCWFFFKNKFFSIFLIVITLISLYLNIHTVGSDDAEAFYSPLTRFWELLFGTFLAYFTLNYKSCYEKFCTNQALVNIFSFVGFFSLGFGFLFINKESSFPGYLALLPVIGATLIILSGPSSIFNRIFLTNRIAVFFGLISFPLYLWHWPLLVFAGIIERDTPDKYFRIAIILLSIIFAWLTYQFIEKGIRRSKGYKYIAILISFSLILFGISFIIFYKNGFSDRKAVTNSDFTKEVRHQFIGAFWPYAKNNICLSKYPYKDQNILAWWFCIQSTNNPPTILLLGDSLANQHYPGFSKNPRLSHHSILSIGTCGIDSDGTGVNSLNTCFGTRPKEQANFIDNIIKKNPSLKFIVIDGISRTPNTSSINKIIERIDYLEKLDLQIIIFTPQLKIDYDIKACFKSPFNQNPKNCLTQSFYREDLLNNFSPLIKAVKKSHPKVLFFEQNDIFCDLNDDNCSFVRDKLPLYRDATHMSEYASLLMQDYFNRWADINLPSIFDSLQKLR
jgi:peptidoglycan/LPS O-acetylase OafA/YrhL